MSSSVHVSPSNPLPASCADDYDPQSLGVDEALGRIDHLIKPIQGRERVALRSALERVLAEAVYSPFDVPAHTNSAIDGFAVASRDLDAGRRIFRVVGKALAGSPYSDPVAQGQAVRIMTGAMMPVGSDVAVMQEHTRTTDGQVEILQDYRAGQNVRRRGEDLTEGSAVLGAGRRLTPADLGLLASLGFAEVSVARRLRVAFFSTGDELRSLGETLGPGEIFDSNRYTLYGMLSHLGVEMVDMGVVRDRREDLLEALGQAATRNDAVITSGGVSVGEADFVKDTLNTLGKVDFWKIAMKPGRPLAFGTVGDAVFFGLPGNPVSVMVTFYYFVRPALLRMMGQAAEPLAAFEVPCTTRLKKRPGRREFQRGVLELTPTGWVVHGTGDQGSGILRTMSEANCFIVLDEASQGVEAGSEVMVQPFRGVL
ncbi:MAG: gephyrin-like molybdotransferase Glp [Candidatus Competibacterales bacterium]